MSEKNEIFKLTAAGLFAFDGDIPVEDLYQAFKARLIQDLVAGSIGENASGFYQLFDVENKPVEPTR